MLHTTQVVLPHHFYRSYHFSERNSLVILRKRLLLNWSPLCKSISNKRPMSHVFYLKNNNQLNRVIHTKYLDNAVEKILYKKIINFFFSQDVLMFNTLLRPKYFRDYDLNKLEPTLP